MTRLQMPAAIRDILFDHARRDLPNECCGLLIGTMDGENVSVSRAIPLVNELHSPTAFRSEPRSLFTAMKAIREMNGELVAVYHSHPTGEAIPSVRDREEITYPDALTVIVGLPEGIAQLRAWQFISGQFLEVEIEVSGPSAK